MFSVHLYAESNEVFLRICGSLFYRKHYLQDMVVYFRSTSNTLHFQYLLKPHLRLHTSYGVLAIPYIIVLSGMRALQTHV